MMPGRPSPNSNLYDDVVAIVSASGSHKLKFLTPLDRRRFRMNFKRRAAKHGFRMIERGIWVTVYKGIVY